MKVMVDLCVVPMGVGVSVSEHIAECEKIIAQTTLHSQLHPYGTVIEGEWDEVFETVKKCHLKLHDSGVVRIFTNMKIGTRIDKEQSMQDKIDSVLNKIQ